MKRVLLLFFLLLVFPTITKGAPSAAEILKKSDKARGGISDGLKWKIQLVDSDGKSPSEFDVQVKGVNVLVKCTAPSRQKGETYLFNDRNLWIHKPGLKKPVSLSSRQRLSGQAANGDIATTNYARDYDGKIEGRDKINGKKVYRMFLTAKSKNITYDKIRYWVTEDTYLGLQAEFLTLDGQPFKKAEFEYNNFVSVGGKKTPFVSKMTIQDSKATDQKSTISYTNPESVKIDDSIFNVNNLGR